MRQLLLRMAAQLGQMFDDRRILFLKELLSSDKILGALIGSGDPLFL
jgi:hypothetical protein